MEASRSKDLCLFMAVFLISQNGPVAHSAWGYRGETGETMAGTEKAERHTFGWVILRDAWDIQAEIADKQLDV